MAKIGQVVLDHRLWDEAPVVSEPTAPPLNTTNSGGAGQLPARRAISFACAPRMGEAIRQPPGIGECQLKPSCNLSECAD